MRRSPAPACKSLTGLVGMGIVLMTVSLVGCSDRGARVYPPKVDPGDVAQRLLESYDTDGDGKISSPDELEACPSLAKSLRAYDANSDGAVSLSELDDRLTKIYQSRVAIYPLFAEVTLNGRPLRGARVRLTPESAFGEAIHVAEGETDGKGFAALGIAESDMPADLRGIVRGVQTGLYRIHIEHATKPLPEKVKNGDHFGAEITAADGNGGIELAIKAS